MRRFLTALAFLFAAIPAAYSQADPPTNPSLPGCWYTTAPSTMANRSSGYVLCDSTHHLAISGSISATSSLRATAAAPTYVEGTDNPFSSDLNGNLRISGTISASTSAKATTADPSYVNNTDNPLSQDLSGHLRTIAQAVQSGAWDIRNITGTVSLPTGAATAAKQPALGTAGSASADVITVQGIASMTALKVDGSGVTQPVSGTFWQATQPVSGTFWQATQPVSGTVTTNPPANASVNVAQLAGTATSVNSGVKDNGSLRVVIATDQPALTNKLLVTPDSVALPANQSVNVNQLAGTATSVNSGNKDAGTLRVILATDQPALTNKLLVTPDSVALPANQSVNVAQMNGVATTMNNGVVGTGVQRIAIASDNSAVSGLGAGATGSAVPANGIYGANNVAGNLTGQIGCGSSATYDASTTGSTQLVAISGSTTIYVCGYSIIAGGTVNVKLVYGTGTNCATAPANITPAWQLTAQAGLVDGSPIYRGLKTTASQALCINASGAVAVQAIVYYTQF